MGSTVKKGIGVSGIARAFHAIGRDFHARGWVLGTSGNFSAVVSRSPFRLAVTASGVSKADLTTKDMLIVDSHGEVVGAAAGKPSAETRLHLAIADARGASAILHTHSVWSTMLSERHAAERGLSLAGFEMLKGLEGVRTHEHAEWIPIIENDQDMGRLAVEVGETLARFPGAHAFLLRRHGLYAWGDDLAQARRHIEILEFLLETTGREASWPS